MAEPAYNAGGLIGFNETTTGGNTNSGNNGYTPSPPKSPPPIPTPPPKESNPPQPKPQKTTLDEVSSVSKPLTPTKKPASKNIRERISVENVIEKQTVGNFEEIDKIRLFGEYPQNFVDIPKYDLSKLNVISDEEVDFNFILCLKDGEESLPRLFVTKNFYERLTNNYSTGNPFGVNDIIDEKNIIVIDIKPLKEKVELLRIAELNTDIDLTSVQESERSYVEVIRNLFVHSNYEKDAVKGLQANPTYTDIELLRYISWAVAKPSNNFDERLIPAEQLGTFKDIPQNADISDDEPSKKIEEELDNNGNPIDPNPNLYPPIGRRGVEDEEEVFYNGKTWTWFEEEESWNLVNRDNGEPLPGGGNNGGSGGSGGYGDVGGGGPRDRS